jgi:phospholipid transport system transporter-binding protein
MTARGNDDKVLRIEGPLTLGTVTRQFREHTALRCGDSCISTIDLAGASRIDSAGLALLLEWQARARQGGNALELRHAPQDLLQLAALCEATELLGVEAVGGHARTKQGASE